MKKRVLAILLTAAITITAFAGCGNSSDKTETASKAEEAGTQAQKTQASETDAPPNTEEASPAPSDTADSGEFKTGDWKIGVTLSANDNSFLVIEENNLNEAIDYLTNSGQVSDVQVVVADYDVSTQISQIQDFIMAGMDAIVLDPVSGSALDGAIKEAYDAGIPVIICQDGPVTSEYCYQMNYDLNEYGRIVGDYLVEACGKGSTWLNIRGSEGTSFDENVQAGLEKVIEANDINVAAELYCDWTFSVAQQKVSQIINSLPKIDGVSSQGGDSYGVAMAFENADLELPIIVGGNRGYFLNWWKERFAETGYETLSISADATDDAMALYAIVDILNGYDIEQIIYLDFVQVTSADLADIEIADENIYFIPHDQQYVRDNIILPNLKSNTPQ